MNTFEHFPKDTTCRICGEGTDKECTLIPLPHTKKIGETFLMEAEPIHTDCLEAIAYNWLDQSRGFYHDLNPDLSGRFVVVYSLFVGHWPCAVCHSRTPRASVLLPVPGTHIGDMKEYSHVMCAHYDCAHSVDRDRLDELVLEYHNETKVRLDK